MSAGGNLRWAFLDPDAAAQSGGCSSLTHSTNSYRSNFAEVAGGAIFSSDLASSRLTCEPNTPASNSILDCEAPAWLDNSVGAQVNALLLLHAVAAVFRRVRT